MPYMDPKDNKGPLFQPIRAINHNKPIATGNRRGYFLYNKLSGIKHLQIKQHVEGRLFVAQFIERKGMAHKFQVDSKETHAGETRDYYGTPGCLLMGYFHNSLVGGFNPFEKY